MEGQKKVEIYYDGVCNLCAGLADTIDLSDRKDSFELKDISKGHLPQDVDFSEAMHDVHVVDETGAVYQGADAVLKVLEHYPRLKWLAAIGWLPGFHGIAKLTYRVVEETRYWIFGRKTV